MALWSQADVDTLKAAVASGILEVRFNGPPERLVRYQSTADLLKVLALAQGDVSRQAGRKNYTLAATRKGF